MKHIALVIALLVVSTTTVAQADPQADRDTKLIADVKAVSVHKLDVALPNTGLEKWLRDQKRIDGPTWKIWEQGMLDVAHFPPFREAWSLLESEYNGYSGFQLFIKQVLILASRQTSLLRASIARKNGTKDSSINGAISAFRSMPHISLLAR